MTCAIGTYTEIADPNWRPPSSENVQNTQCTCTTSKSHPILEAGPNEHYTNDDHCTLRMKFIGLFIFQFIYRTPFQIIYRIFDIFSLSFYTNGYNAAEHAHFSEMKEDRTLLGQTLPI